MCRTRILLSPKSGRRQPCYRQHRHRTSPARPRRQPGGRRLSWPQAAAHGSCKGDRPLHEAADSGHLEACQILIRAGADAEAAGYDGRTPLSRALASERVDGAAAFACAKALAKAGAQVPQMSVSPARMQYLVQTLLQQSTDLDELQAMPAA